MNLSIRISFLSVLLVITTSIGLLFVIQYTTLKHYSPSKLETLELNLNQANDRLVSEIEFSKSLVLAFAGLPPITGIMRATENDGYDEIESSSLEDWYARLIQIWSSHIRYNHDLLQIRYIRAEDGMEIVRVNYDPESPSFVNVVPPEALQNKSSRYYLRETLSLPKGEVYVSPFDLNYENGEIEEPFKPTGRFATPVFDETGKPFGIVIINLNLKRILDNFYVNQNQREFYLLFSEDRDFLLHPDSSFIFGSQFGNENLVDESFLNLGKDSKTEVTTGISELPNFGKCFWAFTKIKVSSNRFFYSIAAQSYQDVALTLGAVRNQTIIMSLILVILSLVAAIVLSRSITRPISTLTQKLLKTKDIDQLQFERSNLHEVNVVQDSVLHFRDQLSEAYEELDEALRAKSQFLAKMSHEIRTPMNGVIGMIQIMNTTNLDAEQKNCLGIIGGSANLLLTIINDILDFSKIDAGKLTLQEAEMHPKKLLKETCELLKTLAEEKNLSFNCSSDPDVPDIIKGDSVRIRQVITNLVGNAIKFTDHGYVKAKMSREIIDDSHDTISISIEDSGVGIESTRLKRIFNAFTQGDDSITRRFGGTGLGLTISNELVKMMGGTIQVFSAVGKGSTFIFSFPCEVIERKSDGSKDLEFSVNAWVDSSSDNHNHRILVAEDKEVNQLVIAAMLGKMGFQYKVVSSGQEVLEILETSNFDVILMDCHMPVMDGYTCTKRIRKSGKHYADIPIIATTASALSSDEPQALQAGMNLHLPKPLSATVLHESIIRFIPSSKKRKDIHH